MEVILFGDVFDHIIIPFLVPIDLYNLVQTCRKYQKKIKMSHIKKSTIREMNRRLYRIFGRDLDGFKSALKNSNGIISGSFVLQCILGEKWDNSDVDVYVDALLFESNTYPNIFNNMPNHLKFDTRFVSDELIKIIDNYEEPCSIKEDIFGFMKRKNYSAWQLDVHGYCSPDLVNIVDYTINTKKIQIIGTTEKNLTSFIMDSYDFDVCKNIYDYNNVTIYCLNDIFTKNTNFNKTYDIDKNVQRYLKYSKRGFEFYSQKKVNKINDINVFDHVGIETIKIIPTDDKYKSITTNNFACMENGIYFMRKPGSISRKDMVFKIQDNNLTLDKIPAYRCDSKCLFHSIYPKIYHLHANVTSSFQDPRYVEKNHIAFNDLPNRNYNPMKKWDSYEYHTCQKIFIIDEQFI
uniref:Uncharacterized protein n=1 Tax=viral metagenome TaxID=1070528 RepID=A0A6C0C6K8_9ZZZZ